MTLDEACVEALKILKQVMEEKLTSTNIEASLYDHSPGKPGRVGEIQSSQGVLVVQRLGLRTFDQAVMGLIPGWGIIRTPRSTQPSIPLG